MVGVGEVDLDFGTITVTLLFNDNKQKEAKTFSPDAWSNIQCIWWCNHDDISWWGVGEVDLGFDDVPRRNLVVGVGEADLGFNTMFVTVLFNDYKQKEAKKVSPTTLSDIQCKWWSHHNEISWGGYRILI